MANKPRLTLHSNGQYCKKHRGKRYYFGTDPDIAEQRYHLWEAAGRPDHVPRVESLPDKVTTEKGFPLWRHPNGQWAKKIDGNVRYFGTDPKEALATCQAESLGTPGPQGGLPLRDLCNLFLDANRQ